MHACTQVRDLQLYDMATPCSQIHCCAARGTSAGGVDLITAAIETAPLGSDLASVMNFEVAPLQIRSHRSSSTIANFQRPTCHL